MTRILVQRGSNGSSSSSSNQNRSLTSLPSSSSSSSSSALVQSQTTSNNQVLSAGKDNELGAEIQEQVYLDEFSVDCFESKPVKSEKSEEFSPENLSNDIRADEEKIVDNDFVSEDLLKGLGGLGVVEEENEGSSLHAAAGSSYPPPPPVPPPKPTSMNSNLRRYPSGSSNALRTGSSRGPLGRPISVRTSPTGSRPSSPRSHCESEGYNSADEQGPSLGPSYDDAVSPKHDYCLVNDFFFFVYFHFLLWESKMQL